MKNHLLKRFFTIVICLSVLSTGFTTNFRVSAQSEMIQTEAPEISPNVVISQFFGGGGSANSPYTHDFVELFNRGSQPISLNGWSTQYASSGGSNWLVTPLSNVTLQPNQYYLIQYGSSGNVGSPLPTPDLLAPAITSGTNTFIPNLSSTSGKLALVNSTAQLSASPCPTDATIVDLVGYGNGASCFEGARTADLNVSAAGKRNGNGCVDTDNNASDFTITSPAPRNTSSPTGSCNVGETLQAGGAANPITVAPGGTILLTVSVIPATTPPSTDIVVVGNLTSFGGASNQQFFDDGTNGDATAGDNVYSYLATVPAGASGGTRTVTAVASDAQSRSTNVSFNFTVNAPIAGGDDPLILGNPSAATSNTANENNYLMIKPQYSLSYNRSRATANWVAWRLDSSWIGTADRQDDFRPDPDLPVNWYHVNESSYSGSGFDRGHHAPSGDRTRSTADNSATFLMTNMMPQAGGNNQGPWEKLESFSRTLASQGNELYIMAGGTGIGGIPSGTTVVNTIDNGRITVPAQTWKVILVLPAGDNDLSRVNNNTRTIAVIMPNVESIRPDGWAKYIATVDQVEALTGYDFFSNVAPQIQAAIESKLDAPNNAAPTASARSINTNEDTAQNVTLAASDANVNSQITYIIVNNPAHGTLSGSGANLTYTPEANYFGSDSFTYKASDGTAESAPATVSINVTQVNDAPFASPDSKIVSPNVALNFPASDLLVNDNAGAANENTQTLTVTQVITTAQTHGQVSLTNGQVTYQPDANYSGPASFDYQVCDNGTTNGQSDIKCSISTVNLNVGTVVNFEADVSPRGTGDGAVSSTDVSIIQGFQLGLGLPYQSNEFQRADCAPFETRGDGQISSIDVSQAQAYQLGLNLTAQGTYQPAAGPSSAARSGSAFEFDNWLPWTPGKAIAQSSSQPSREVRIANGNARAGQTIVVPIEVNALGDEAVYGFSLSYDQTKLSNPVISIGGAGGAVLSNTAQPGNIGISVTFGGGTIAAGDNQRLINVQFTVADNASAGTTPLKFTNALAIREVASTSTNPSGVIALPTNFTDGILNMSVDKTYKRARFF